MLPLFICALLLSWPLVNALALEPREADLVPIGAVLADPQHYNLHRVRFHGTITGMAVLPHQGGCRMFDAYLFQFEDETGSIEVFDIGKCAMGRSVAPLLVVNPVQVGERLSIAATIVNSVYSTHAPGPLIQARLEWIGKSHERLP